MQHFHRPENRNNRFMASLTEQERAILRDVERPILYSTKQQRQQQNLQEQQGTAYSHSTPHSRTPTMQACQVQHCRGNTYGNATLTRCCTL
jgi:hypothetical protein